MADGNQKIQATTLVIFGVTGDLSSRYLLPALAEICRSSEVSAELKILGVTRQAILAEDVLKDNTKVLAGQFQVMQMDYQRPEEYRKLRDRLSQIGSEQTIFYFAVPPAAVLPIIANLGVAGMNDPQYKLLLEKPFGTDLGSARLLIEETDKHFKEEQVFRIDHYLAKEMAQNIAVFLGSNVLFRDVWNNGFIERIEVSAEEAIGIEGRGKFYEQTGALRDIVQSHLLQLAALTLMKPCSDVFDMSEVRPRRLAALKQLRAEPESVVKAQYQGYKEEAANPQSAVETFVSLTLVSGDPGWKGVPIQLVTGKSLDKKQTEIRVHFKKSQSAQANLLRLRIQPKEGIELELWVKKPGYEQDLQKMPLDFNYQQYFDRLPDAYEQVIVDAMRGRSDLFASSQEVLASWEILQPLLDRWPDYPLKDYKSGTAADMILQAE